MPDVPVVDVPDAAVGVVVVVLDLVGFVFVVVVVVPVVVAVVVFTGAAFLITPKIAVPRLSTSTQMVLLQAIWLTVACDAFFNRLPALQLPRTGELVV